MGYERPERKDYTAVAQCGFCGGFKMSASRSAGDGAVRGNPRSSLCRVLVVFPI